MLPPLLLKCDPTPGIYLAQEPVMPARKLEVSRAMKSKMTAFACRHGYQLERANCYILVYTREQYETQ